MKNDIPEATGPAADVLTSCWHTIGVWRKAGNRCSKLAEILHCRYCPVFAEAGRRMLDRELEDDYRNELTRLVARKKTEHPSDLVSGFIFKAGTEWLALSSMHVQEIVEMGPIHSVPHRTNSVFRGLVNVRGKLELCFSVGGVLGIEPASREEKDQHATPERLVVASRGDFRLVFPVSEVIGSRRFRQAEIRKAPVTVSRARAAFTRGIITIDSNDIGLLNEPVMFNEFEKNLA